MLALVEVLLVGGSINWKDVEHSSVEEANDMDSETESVLEEKEEGETLDVDDLFLREIQKESDLRSWKLYATFLHNLCDLRLEKGGKGLNCVALKRAS